MPKVKNHDPVIDEKLREYVGMGWSTKRIMDKLEISKQTLFNYTNDLGLTIGRKKNMDTWKENPRTEEDTPKDPTKKEPNPEETIKENITKKHVKDISEKLATLTVEHELEMRKLVVALEKHTAIFQSVEQMGLPREKFLDVAIEIGYENAKEAYMKKVREAEEREAMKEYLELRRKMNGE